MELTEIIAIAAGVVAVVIAAIAYQRSGEPISITGITETLTNAQTLAAELRDVAEIGVVAAQQLKERGDITTNEEAFQHAFRHVQRWYECFGGTQQLDAETIANAVEAIYRGVKLAGKLVEAQRGAGEQVRKFQKVTAPFTA